MNRHFKDAQYYLTRAGSHAKRGLKEELEPVERKVRELTGREKQPAPSRIEKIQRELARLERRAEGEAKRAIADARERIAAYRRESESESEPSEEPRAAQ